VTNPYTRHPALLAMASATLDRISGGRFLLGLGRSDKPVIQDKMVSRTAILAQRWKKRSLSLGVCCRRTGHLRCGRFKLSDARLATTPIQQKLPIYLAAIGAKGLRLAVLSQTVSC